MGAEPSEEPRPDLGRRGYDGSVVSLQEHLEDKIAAGHRELRERVDRNYDVLTAELAYLGERITQGQRRQTEEHSEVGKRLDGMSQRVDGMTKTVSRLAETIATQRVTVKTLLWAAGALSAVVTFTGVVVVIVKNLTS